MAEGGSGLMVSVSGIRGRVGAALTPEVVSRYAAAFGAWSIRQGKSRKIVVGRDSRVSGPMFHRIVVGTLQLAGCDVIDIGLTTTPGCQLAVEHHHAAGGLMLSASHNPIEWNALKLIGASGLFLEASEGLAMRALIESGIPYASWPDIGSVSRDTTPMSCQFAYGIPDSISARIANPSLASRNRPLAPISLSAFHSIGLWLAESISPPAAW